MKTLYFFRGLTSSGKSNMAAVNTVNVANVVAAYADVDAAEYVAHAKQKEIFLKYFG